MEGFDRYIEGASRVIHHTPNIKRLRALEKEARTRFGDTDQLNSFVENLLDYTNNLSGKQSAIDRGIESLTGRKVYAVTEAIRRKVSLNMIGGNLASALTSYIPVTQSLATTNKKAFAKGMYEAFRNIFKNDGFVNKSDYLTRRYGSKKVAMGKLDKVVDKSMIMMQGFDRFASNIIVRSKYLENLAKGIPEKEALKQADNWAAKIMADRSLGATPTLFNAKSLNILTQFQIEIDNQLSFLFKDIPRNFNKKQTVSALAQAALYGYMFNEAFERIAGRRVAIDPIGLAIQAYEDYTNPELDKKKASKNAIQGVLDQLPYSSMFTGGRIPIGAALPNPMNIIEKEFSARSIADEIKKPLTYLLPPTAGGQIKKTFEGSKALNLNPLTKKQEIPGLYQKTPKGEAQLKIPIEKNLSNIARGIALGQYSFPEVKEYYGNNRRPLSVSQTKELQKKVELYKGDTNKLYTELQIDRRIKTIENKLKEARKERDTESVERYKMQINDLKEKRRSTLK